MSAPVFQAKRDQKRNAGLALFYLAFAAALLAFSGVLDSSVSGRRGMALGFVLAPIMAMLGLLYASRLLENGVQLRVSDEGILFARYSDKVIAWSDIAGIETEEAQTVRIRLHEDSGPSPSWGWMLSYGLLASGNGVSVSMRGLHGTAEQLVTSISRHWAQYRALRDAPKAFDPRARDRQPQAQATTYAGFGKRKAG
ncbi:hypothetical protein [Sphingomicrobium sediminis]|uniref:PH domain-containing protein n=1 Tax=Sphingomicrobium sediminis TaxID=2950949 RepID=A0A9X2EEM2_9SPHN|nr:hypothetical protein [Sphingomicrobium sediminis]MCM8556560.1 hypothetical protein [Sphingomicrobium sediminis]